jgi:8-oxo-dGTP diphosphatase
MPQRAQASIYSLPHNGLSDSQLSWAAIIARYQNQWLMVKHKDRATFEYPGGKREPGESIIECAHREFYEETGASQYSLQPLTTYSMRLADGKLSYGLMCTADVESLSELPAESEMERVAFFDELPDELTYPKIIPELLRYISELKK